MKKNLLWTYLRSLIIVPMLFGIYIFSLNQQGDTLIPQNLSEQFGLALWLLGSLIDALQRGRFPSINEILTIPRNELFLSIVLVWLFTTFVFGTVWLTIKRLFPKQRWIVPVLLATIVFLLFLPVLLLKLPTPSTATIQVNTLETRGVIPINQRGFSQGGEIEMMQPGFFSGIADLIKPLQPQLIRIDHVFDYYNVYQIGGDGQPVYNWTELDRVVDAIVSTGAKPLISLSYLPPALAQVTVYSPPTDWNKWEELVYQTVRHFNGDRKLGIQYWEVWNEPNLTSFWIGTLDDYLRLYEMSARGARRADPTVHIGGPAVLTLQPEEGFAAAFWEDNWISSLVRYTQAHNLPFDFLSWHYYESRPINFVANVEHHQRLVADMGVSPELLITEWNFAGGLHPAMDNELGAAYAASVVTYLADTPLRAALFFEPFDSSNNQWEGHWGLLRRDKTAKPVYYTFSLLSKLQGDRLLVTSDHKLAGALAAKHDDTIEVLVWNIKPEALTVNLSMTGLVPDSQPEGSLYKVDAQHSNAYHNNDTGQIFMELLPVQVDGKGQLALTLDMPNNSVWLVEIKP